MPNQISNLKPVTFLAEVKSELSKVVWPTRAQAIRLTAIVIGVSVAVGLFIGVLDFLLTKLTEIFIYR